MTDGPDCHRTNDVNLGPVELLILQATPFCNIDCDYCYLPNRTETRRMSMDTIAAAIRNLAIADLVRGTFSVVWHAGEPLVAGTAYFEDALATVSRTAEQCGARVRHSIQTNGTLITPEWCDLFVRHRVRVGVSLDGPRELHDAHRKTRQQKGTFDAAMRGLRLLQKAAVETHVLTVITKDTLSLPDELFQFYVDNGISYVGLNVEEVDGVHRSTSLSGDDTLEKYRAFIERLHRLAMRTPAVKIREFSALRRLVLSEATIERTQQARPYAIVSVDHDGNFSTFSPELLGMTDMVHGRFTLGNVHADSYVAQTVLSRMSRIRRGIDAGISQCRSSCEYFGLCGGGSPSNKLFENGTFASAGTRYCALSRKVIIDVVLAALEEQAGLAPVAAEAI